MLGIRLLPWQRWLLIHALELRPDGRFRFRTVLILVARQNGKTSLIEVKNLWKMFVLRVRLVIGTAQNMDISEESWDKAVEIVESIPDLAAEIGHVDKTNGKKALKLADGARWKLAAASRKGGRGLSGDDVNLDELREHQTWDSWAAVSKTTMARRNPQVYAFSNAGDDKSVVLNDLQKKARATVEHPTADLSLGCFEWSAPDDVECTCDRPDGAHRLDCRLQDREVWAQANPSLGYMITEEALMSALATDPEPVFLTECLCKRVPDLAGAAINPAQWSDGADPKSRREGDVAVAVDISPDRDYTSVAVYGLRADEFGHAQLVDHRPGTDWVIDRMVELKQALDPVAFAMGRGTAASLETDLAKVGISRSENPEEPRRGDLMVTSATDMAGACGQIIDAVRQGVLRHVPQPALDAAVAGARTRQAGDTIAWSRKDTDADIGPLVAVTLARWAFVSRAHLVTADYDVLDSVL